MKKDSEEKWSAEISFDEIGQYQYFFVLYSGSAVKVYCDDKNKDYGKGTLASLNEVIPYDLSVYDSAFTTLDWMKNAVIYQIFPDRFCNGNKDNDTAQTASRGASDYELVDWSLYPENPEQEGLRSESDYKATNAFWGDRVWNNEIYGGDFQGIVDNIDYLKALGVNVIYLNPVFSSVSSHRYDESDYTTMDPIVFTQGKGITFVYPYNKGYEMNGQKDEISFLYRDDSRVANGTEGNIEKVEVVVNGTKQAMEYDEDTE